MPRNDRLLQSLFAAAMIPVAAIGLTACASDPSPEADRGDNSSSSNDAGERPTLPFTWGDAAETDAATPDDSNSPTQPAPSIPAPPSSTGESDDNSTGDTGNSGGSSGGNVVRYGDVDISDKDWDVSCSDDYANAYDFDGPNDDDYHSVSVSLNSDGSVAYVMIDSDPNHSVYYSDGVGGGYPELSAEATYVTGERIKASGTGTVDYEFTEFEDFEISLECDYTY